MVVQRPSIAREDYLQTIRQLEEEGDVVEEEGDVVDELDVVDVADEPVPHAPAPASAVAERDRPFATTAFL